VKTYKENILNNGHNVIADSIYTYAMLQAGIIFGGVCLHEVSKTTDQKLI